MLSKKCKILCFLEKLVVKKILDVFEYFIHVPMLFRMISCDILAIFATKIVSERHVSAKSEHGHRLNGRNNSHS